MSMVSTPPYYGCSVFSSGAQIGNCCDALPIVVNITSGANVCQTTSSDSTKTLQSCLSAVSGNSNTSVACNYSGKASGARQGVKVLGSALLGLGFVAVTVLTTMA
ncbi:unnamed protein product [Tilletia controversa]|uniref:Uncharacterized protein n=3 Tax=Tilletia TaxID=13289 RepID=A0A8X7MLH2_9BASI|nr:hypothetical protein CF336_g5791 [Tilletia laevis]KAE8193044.1 hypothetical protein CF328_g5167 [Tilletia controversa]KAE8256913.1 hypothetical protein A4X03_0g4932 [Tilletia caries]KAE8202372.1 hypothetical protein CF335_g3439 [Tilletia laevis]KAE8240436.1 hypothetical protein A4X06_0g7772 [Tilletia controversa]